MTYYDPAESGRYGAVFAPVYDTLYPGGPATDAAVATLARLAGPGPVLELGVGTGRIALPLAATGVEVHGLDGSPDMLDTLADKPGASQVKLIAGDLRDDHGSCTYRLVTLLAQTLFLLPDAEAQQACLASAAQALLPDGRLVVEGYAQIPEPFRHAGHGLQAVAVEENTVVLAATHHDPLTQTLLIQHILIGGPETQLLPVRLRYAWPAELDLMARIAGLTLEHRWADWHGTPPRPDDLTHVSVYRPAGPHHR